MFYRILCTFDCVFIGFLGKEAFNYQNERIIAE